MFRIGDFSRLNKVSVKTLRYYDEIGLLKPTEVDEQNGYRYYTAGQIPRLHRILVLKDFGFSLQEIEHLLDLDKNAHETKTLLEQKRQELQASIREQQDRLARLHTFIQQQETGSDQMQNYSVVVKEVPAMPVVSLRDRVANFGEQSRLWNELLSQLGEQRVQVVAPLITTYYDDENEENGVDLEMSACYKGQPVANDRICLRELEGAQEMACVIHKGSEETLTDAYAALQTWMEANAYKLAGPGREAHLVGYWITTNTEEHVTEIQIPVVKEAK